MKRTLPIFHRTKLPAVIFISVFVFIITLAQGAAAQEVAQTGNTLYNTNTLSGNNIAVGEIVWVVITLVFSFGLNLYLRRNEKRPEKSSIPLRETAVQQLETLPVKQKAEAIKIIRNKRTNKLAHKFAYQRERVMQPFTAVHFLTVSQKKTNVAS